MNIKEKQWVLRFYHDVFDTIEDLHNALTKTFISSTVTINIDMFEKLIIAKSNAGNCLTYKNRLIKKSLHIWERWFNEMEDFFDTIFTWEIDYINQRFVLTYTNEDLGYDDEPVVYTTYVWWIGETK